MNTTLDLGSLSRQSFGPGKLFLSFVCFQLHSCLCKRILTWNLDRTDKGGADLIEVRGEA